MDTCTFSIRSVQSHDPHLPPPWLAALAAAFLALVLVLPPRDAPPFGAPACEVGAPAEHPPFVPAIAPGRRSRSGQRPASSRGRTWRPRFRPTPGARRILAARRRSQGAPPGAPPGGLPEGSREPTEDELEWLEGETERFERLARRLGVRSTDAPDVAQEAVKLALEAWGTWPTDRDTPHATLLRRWLTGFLFRATSRYRYALAHDPLRSKDLQTPEHSAVSVPSSEGITSARWTLRALQGETSPENWRAWVARHVDGLPVSQIAHNEGTPKATIYNRIRLAQRDFRAARAREEARADGPMVRRKRPIGGE